MAKKRLFKKQLAVIEDLFAGELDEQGVLDKYKVRRNLYNKWLSDQRFVQAFEEHVARSVLESRLIIARYAPLAAAKLVRLTDSDSPETARKACLDIISQDRRQETNPQINLGAKRLAPQFTAGSGPDSQGPTELSPETAGKLLVALAEAQPQQERD
jgi:hypothetical protein